MTDSRISEFTKWWCELEYPKTHYNQKYIAWNSAHAKETQRLIKMFDREVKGDPVEKLKECATAYLKAPDPYYRKAAHSFLLFVSSIQVWMDRLRSEQTRVAPPPAREVINDRELRKPTKMSDDNLKSKLSQDPVTKLKGLMEFGGMDSKIPAIQRAWKAMIPILGAEKMDDLVTQINREREKKLRSLR